MTLANDPVDVVATFEQGQARPARFRWDGRVYNVKRVNLIHAFHSGRAKVFSFSVSDDANFWKLQFNTETLEWRLVEYAGE